MKQKATVAIIQIYRSNRERLSFELAKPEKDVTVINNIAAFRYIVSQMEEVYNLVGV
ncbi:MAG: hypothetical protein HY815_28805 [Candidatus Riflebacteria bacterium]|nr:hypothetical protein [Candidatus Riflebacteria bacterium]